MTVAVLFARADSHYKALPDVEVYDMERDAKTTVVRGMAIPGFPGYYVTETGHVISSRTNAGKVGSAFRVRRTALDGKGYPSLTLIAERHRLKRRVHRLVAEGFVANPLGLPCVRHLDGDKENNAATNLAWGSYLENENDKHRHGTWALRVGGGKLNVDDRATILSLHAAGVGYREIAASLSVHRDTVYRVVRGKTWAWKS